MPGQRERTITARTPLTKERVLRAAVELADEQGIGALTMRNLAQMLGVEAMSLYHHVANKEEVLDGISEMVLAQINAAVEDLSGAQRAGGAADGAAGDRRPVDPGDWKQAMRQRILRARDVLLAHPWAPGVIESRTTMGPEIMRYYDGIAGHMKAAGFSMDLVHHAMHALGSRALGFTQELFDAEGGDDEMPDAETLAQMADLYPNITEMVAHISHDADTTLGWCDDQFEFEFGLDLILDGLERLRAAEASSGASSPTGPAG